MSAIREGLDLITEDELRLQRVNRYLKIAVITRFIAVVGILAAVQAPQMRPIDLRTFFIILGLETVANVTYFLVGFKRWPHGAFHFSGLIDVIAIGYLIGLTGGSDSYFGSLFALVIVFNCVFYGWTGIVSGTLPSIASYVVASVASDHPTSAPKILVMSGLWLSLSYLCAVVGTREQADRKELHESAITKATQTRQLQALYETSTSISTQLEAEALLSTALEKAHEMATMMWGEVVTSISLLDEDRTHIEVVRVTGGEAQASPGIRFPVGVLPEPTLRTLFSREPMAKTAAELGEMAKMFDIPAHHTVLAAPIASGDKLLGMLGVRSVEGAKPRTEQMEILITIANHIASALSRVASMDEIKAQRAQATALFELARDLNRMEDVDDILHRLSEAAVAIVGVEAAGVGMLDPTGDEVLARGWALRDVEGPSRELVASLGPIPLGWVAERTRRGETVVVDDLTSLPDLAGRALDLFTATRVAGFPIYIRDRVGAILLFGRLSEDRPFSINELQLGESLSGLAAVTLSNITSFQAQAASARENAALFQVAQVVSASLDRHEVLNTISKASLDATGANWSAIFLIEEGHLAPKNFSVREGSSAWHLERIEVSGRLRNFLRAGLPVVVDQSDQATSELIPLSWFAAMPISRLILAPLTIRNEALGLLALDLPHDQSSDTSARVAHSIAALAAAAIENADRFEAEKEAVAELKKLDRLKTEFVSTASHELRSPLTSITGYAKTLLRRGDDFTEEQRQEFLEIIDKQAKQLARLIDDLLTVSKIEEGKLNLNLHPIDVKVLSEDLVVAMKLRTDRHTFDIAVPDGFPPVIGDESKLTEIVSNLIDNAIKYSPDGGKITVGGETRPGEIVIWVSDQGGGMDPEVADKIFDKFYQADDRPQAGGAGLGLYIVQELVKAHDGRVWVQSDVGRGTTFYVSLPQRRASDRVRAQS